MASRPRSSSKAAKLVKKLKEKISPTKVSPKRKRDDALSSVSQDHSTQSPEGRPMKRLKSALDPSSESSQNVANSKANTSNTKKTKRELKIEADRKRLEAFYNEKSNFFAQFDSFELKAQTPKKDVRKGAMDPLDASLGDIEPNDVDLDFLLDSDKGNKSRGKDRRRSTRLQHQDPKPSNTTPKKGSDKLPEAKKFFDTNLEALASSNIDGDHLSDSSPKSKPQRRSSNRSDLSASERDVEEKLEKEADFEYEETPPVIYNSGSIARSLGASNGSRPAISKKASKKEVSETQTSMKAPEVPVPRKRSARQLASAAEPSTSTAVPEQRHTRQSSRSKKPREGLENPDLLEEYNDFLEDEHREGNTSPWSLQEYYEKVWKAAGFK